MTQRICSLEDCGRPHYAKGLCTRDYARQRRTGTSDAPPDTCRKAGHPLTPDNVITDARTGKRRCRKCREAYKAAFTSEVICSVPGCGRPQLAKGLCSRDYQRMKTKGNTNDPATRTPAERAEAVRANARRYRDRNRDLIRRRARDRYRRNRTAELQRVRRYRRAHAGKIRAYNRRWTIENPGRRTELSRRWVNANPEQARANWAAKRARRQRWMRATADGRVSYKAILDEHGMTCHLCGGVIESRAHLHFDHVIPRQHGGRHVQENIRPAHAVCNLRKGNRLLP